MKEVKVSVIVPVYNVEKYLEQCLQSIMNQTLDNIEIIIVNDGSTDNSINIINKFKNNHDNIKVIEQENAGLSAARNTGLKQATGKYALFLDSDDFIDVDMLEKLYYKAEKFNCPLVICDLQLYWNERKTNKYNNLKENENKIYKKDELYKILLSRKLNCQFINKLYRRDLLVQSNLKFQPNKYYEDIVPSFKIFNIYKEAMFINDSMYKYRMRQGSITSSSSTKKILDFIENVKTAREYAIDNSSIKTSQLNKYVMSFNINYGLYAMELNKLLSNGDDLSIEISKYITLKYNIFKVIFNNKISIKTKIKYFIYLLSL